MCAACVMTAAVGATGARTWLQAQHRTWLTPKRMKLATILLCTAALLISTVGLGGSTKTAHGHATAVHRAESR